MKFGGGKEEYKMSMEALTTQVNELRVKMDAIVLPKNDISAQVEQKTAQKTIFTDLVKQKQDLISQKTTILTSQKSIQENLKKNTNQFKSKDQVDAKLRELERQLSLGVATLADEKFIIKEISALTRIRSTLLNSVSDEVKLDQLRAEFKVLDQKIKTLDPAIDTAKEALLKVEEEIKTIIASTQSLYDNKKNLSEELKNLKIQKSQLYESHKKEQEEYYAKIKADQDAIRNKDANDRAAQKGARSLQAAERELDEASAPAFSSEIAVIAALVKFFETQAPKSDEQVEKVAVLESIDTNAQPDRSTLLIRKGDRDENFLCLGGGKEKKKRGKKSSASKSIKMDLKLIDQLGSFSIAIPKTVGDVEAVVEALLLKREFYTQSSDSKTSENRAVALSKVEKLREKFGDVVLIEVVYKEEQL